VQELSYWAFKTNYFDMSWYFFFPVYCLLIWLCFMKETNIRINVLILSFVNPEFMLNLKKFPVLKLPFWLWYIFYCYFMVLFFTFKCSIHQVFFSRRETQVKL
jgi:hypothetical protein